MSGEAEKPELVCIQVTIVSAFASRRTALSQLFTPLRNSRQKPWTLRRRPKRMFPQMPSPLKPNSPPAQLPLPSCSASFSASGEQGTSSSMTSISLLRRSMRPPQTSLAILRRSSDIGVCPHTQLFVLQAEPTVNLRASCF